MANCIFRKGTGKAKDRESIQTMLDEELDDSIIGSPSWMIRTSSLNGQIEQQRAETLSLGEQIKKLTEKLVRFAKEKTEMKEMMEVVVKQIANKKERIGH